MKKAALEEVRAVAKAARPVGKGVEKLGNVDHQIKKARVDGMLQDIDKGGVTSCYYVLLSSWYTK